MRWISTCARRITTEALEPLGRLVAPPLCDVCGEGVPDGGAVCPSCRGALTPYGPSSSRHFRKANMPRIIAYRYDGTVARALIHRFKYQGATRLARFLASAIAARWDWSKLPGRRIVLVPVPLSNGRLRERGYNQARLLAEALAETLHLPMMELLCRVRPARSQTRLSERERMLNSRRAFAARTSTPLRPLVIIDDVWTTGATALACREVLVAAGHRVAACAAAFWTPSPTRVEGGRVP